MRKIGRYEILQQLGQGSMGTVYKAWDPLMGRDVAIKTIPIDGPQSAEVRTRFLQEAKAAGKLAHPGIVTVFDVCEHEGMPFLVMEYVEGHTLQSLIQNKVRLDLDSVCDLGIQLAEALDYAHRNGVIHRDVKPANILLTKKNRTKITDFGVAKLIESPLTSTGLLLGTPAFMAPEQFTGQSIDGRADLFAVAVVIYCLATGDRPFTGDSVLSVQYKVVEMTPVPPSRLNPAIDPTLEAVILRGIEKDPSRRYQSGKELADDLRATRAGRLVQVGTRSVAYRDVFESIPSDPSATTPGWGTDYPIDYNTLLTHRLENTRTSVIPPGVRTSRGGFRSRAAIRSLVVATLVVGLFALMTYALVKPAQESAALLNTVSPPLLYEPFSQAPAETAKEEDSPHIENTDATPQPAEEPAPLTEAGDVKPAKVNHAEDHIELGKTEKKKVLVKTPAVTGEASTSGLRPVSEITEKEPAVEEPSSLVQQFEATRMRGQLPLPRTRGPMGRQLLRSPEAAPPTDSAQLLISSLDLPDSLTLIVTMDGNEVLLGGDNSSARTLAKAVPLAEFRLLPPGEHKLQVNVMQGVRRVGPPQEITSRFYAGQRRTLQIIFETDQRSGREVRNSPHFSIALR
jgi:serine/threonine protein kinase